MTPLHLAVIENDAKRLSDKDFINKWKDVPDALGFNPLEIAKFLGKNEAIKVFGDGPPHLFQVQLQGQTKVLSLSLEDFEKAFEIRYRPFLTFSSYSSLKEVVNQCPYILRSHSLANDNYEETKIYQKELDEGKTAPIAIRWIDPVLGYGAFATEKISEGRFVGEYTGIVRRLFRRHTDSNAYCFHYPTKFWSFKYFTIDSMLEGNLTRFINHSSSPNLKPVCLIDKRLLHLVFVSNREIKAGEQLTFDYGEDYWQKRQMVDL